MQHSFSFNFWLRRDVRSDKNEGYISARVTLNGKRAEIATGFKIDADLIHLALINEWLDEDPFVKLKCTIQETTRDLLTEEELHLLREKKKKSVPLLSQIRWAWCRIRSSIGSAKAGLGRQ